MINQSGHGRQYVTVLFADLSGSSEHAELLEEEEFSAVLTQMRHLARATVQRHGGVIARLQGDGVLALFGMPVPHEDDGRRAIEAALDLHAAVARIAVGGKHPLLMHSGIHAGLSLLIEGDVERGRFDIVGEVPNTAARLCGLAAGGQICVSADTLGRHARLFQATMLQKVPIKGRSAPLDVLLVHGREPASDHRTAAATARHATRLVGRGPMLGALADAAARAREVGVGAVAVLGEPGIGKTRLLDEFIATLDTATHCAVQGYCENYLGAEPLQPFLQAARQLQGERAVQAGEQAQVHSAATMAALLRAAAGRRLLVLALDDWQWADDASRLVLQGLLGDGLPVCAVVGMRADADDDLPAAPWHRLPLAALDADEAAAAVDALLPQADPFVAQDIVRRSGGSPLFIEELCHAAAAGNTRWSGDARRGTAGWFGGLIASRLARLPAAQASLVRAAAVLGTAFPAWLLQRVAGGGGVDPPLHALEVADFLYPAKPAGMLRFKHVLTRDALYHLVDPHARRAIHQQAADALRQSIGAEGDTEGLELLAYHAGAAGLCDEAARLAEAAGDKAMGALALDRARVQYTAALRALQTLPDSLPDVPLRWLGLTQKLGMACVFDPLDLAGGLPFFDRAALFANASGDRNAMARTEYWLAYLHYGRGRPATAVQHGQRALALAGETGDERLVVQIQATLGQTFVAAGRYGDAAPLLTAAIDGKRRQSRPGSRVAIGAAYTWARKAYMWGDQGRFGAAQECFGEARRLAGEELHPVGSSICDLESAVLLWQGRWSAALAVAEEGARIALHCRSRYLLAMARSFAACARWMLSADPAAVRALGEATHWIDARGGGSSTSINHGWLVDAHLALGDGPTARRHAALLLVRARWQDQHGLAMGCRALARQAASAGRDDRALQYLARADRAAARRQSARERALNDLCRAGVLLLQGRPPGEAAALLGTAHETFQRLEMLWHADEAQRRRSALHGSA